MCCWCAGDVWDVQPAPKDHPWRTMKNHGMTAHVAGNTLDAQARYQQARRTPLGSHFPSPLHPLLIGTKFMEATDPLRVAKLLASKVKNTQQRYRHLHTWHGMYHGRCRQTCKSGIPQAYCGVSTSAGFTVSGVPGLAPPGAASGLHVWRNKESLSFFLSKHWKQTRSLLERSSPICAFQGTKDILDAWLNNRPFQDNFYIVREGELAPQYK